MPTLLQRRKGTATFCCKLWCSCDFCAISPDSPLDGNHSFAGESTGAVSLLAHSPLTLSSPREGRGNPSGPESTQGGMGPGANRRVLRRNLSRERRTILIAT